jgi:hypothetical protein
MRQKKKTVTSNNFLDSRYFKSFMTFADYVVSVNLSSPMYFIEYMCKCDFPPNMWGMADVYDRYMEHLDSLDPIAQSAASARVIMNLADEYDIDVSEVFDVVPAATLLTLLETRHLSPYLVTRSKKFADMIHRQPLSIRSHFTTITKSQNWDSKSSVTPTNKNTIQQIIQALGL